MSEVEIERIKARIANLGELGKSIDRKLCWLGDKKFMTELLEKTKKEFPVDSELISVMTTGRGKLGIYKCDPYEIVKWFVKNFGEPQK